MCFIRVHTTAMAWKGWKYTRENMRTHGFNGFLLSINPVARRLFTGLRILGARARASRSTFKS